MSQNGIYCPMSDFLTQTHTDTTKPLIDRQKRSRGANIRKAEAVASAFKLFE